MVPTVCLETLPYCVVRSAACSAMKDRIARRSFISSSSKPCSSATLECDVEHAFLDVVQIHHPGEQQRTHFRDGCTHGMALLPEHVPKHGRKPVGLEGEAHIAGPFDDKILGLADLGDAREVALDIGREHRNAGARKSLRHHLQRDGFSGSGGAGDEAMAICKPERQPGRLFTLPDEDFLVGIGHLVVGRRHCIASPRASRAQSPGRHDPIASCKPIEPGQRHLGDRKPGSWRRGRPASCFPATKVGSNRLVHDNLPANFATALALLQHSPRDRG